MSTRARTWLARVAVIVCFGGVLEIVAVAGWVSPTVLPPLHDILSTFVTEVTSGGLLAQAGETFRRLLFGMLIGTLCGLALGVFFWRVPSIGRGLEPLVGSLSAVPWIFFYPLLLLFLGINSGPIVLLAAVRVFVPVTLNVLVGLRDVPPIYYKVGRTFRLSQRQTILKIVTPAAAVYLLAGLEVGAIYGFLSVVGTEFLISDKGLGYVIAQDYNLFRVTHMYAYVLTMVVIAFAFNGLRSHALARLRRD